VKKFILVQSVGQASVNITRFNGALMASLVSKHQEPLADILAGTQSWYAYEYELETPGGGGFSFGPSKFVGYKEMDRDTYLANNGVNGRLNGRDTEKVLSKMSTPLTASDPRYGRAYQALTDLCAHFGKSINSRARISMLNLGQDEQVAKEAKQVEALATLISALSDDAKKELKRQAFP